MDEDGRGRQFPVHWRVILQVGRDAGQVNYRGHTHDISLHGSSVLLRENVPPGKEVALLLAVPPLDNRHEPQVLRFPCKIELSLFVSKLQCFQVKLRFLAEARPSCEALDRALSSRYGPLV